LRTVPSVNALRAFLQAHTEAPIRQGRLESLWEQLVGGVILGEPEEAQQIVKQVRSNLVEQTPARRVARTSRPGWSELVSASEGLLRRSWSDMTSRYGDWGRNGVMAVATRHLGWRLIEVVREIPGLSYRAAAQGIRQFWKHLAKHPEQEAFRKALLMQMLNLQI